MKGLLLTITLLGRGFSARKVRTVTRIDRKTGDTIRVQQTYYDTEAHQFRGSFERVGSRWRLHTATGYYDLAEGRHHSYVRDRLGSTVAVVDDRGRTEQLTAYYPSGVPYGLFGLGSVTDRLHIGNRWMAQSGFNTYDNTARMHYPLLPSFDTPDPLSQDYPHLSPYSHCAGNPLSIIDPTGERIVVSSAGTEYEYKKTPEDGYCFVDSNGKYPIGTHSFLYDVETALNKIQQGKNGNEMVNYLINNSNVLTITPIDNKHTENVFSISGNKIFWDSKSNEGGRSELVDGQVSTTRPSYIGLAHEMAHAEDKWKGTMNQKIWIKNGPQNIPFSEAYACKRENQVRFEHKIPLRTHYLSGKHLGYDVIESSRIIFFIPPHSDINILYH